MSIDSCSIVGATPALLLTESVSPFGFAPIQHHIRARLALSTLPTSLDPRYCGHFYDILTNLTTNHEDTRLILNQGLAICDAAKGG